MSGLTAAFVDRMYLPRARVAHLVERNLYGSRVSKCGRFPWPNDWHGTGSQDEYERAERLPLCKLCAGKVQPPPVTPYPTPLPDPLTPGADGAT